MMISALCFLLLLLPVIVTASPSFNPEYEHVNGNHVPQISAILIEDIKGNLQFNSDIAVDEPMKIVIFGSNFKQIKSIKITTNGHCDVAVSSHITSQTDGMLTFDYQFLE